MHSGPFGCLTNSVQNGPNKCKCSCHEVASEFFTTKAFGCVSYYLGAFGTVWLPYELGAKQAELVQKFVPRSRVGIFRNERTRSVPVDSKLMFWCVLLYLSAFRTVWLPYETRCKTGRTSAKVRATKSRRNFSQRTHPIHPIGP